ncbi:MAG TPA: HD domain-containing phosphohydrolase [Coleofasciculaceae cyanobacterium]
MLRPGDAEILSFLEQIQLARNLQVGLRCYRLRTMCLNLARWLRLDQEQMRQLIFLSYCHGLGKIGIPDSILLKPTSLNEQEWAKIREYPEVSELICNQLPTLREFASLVRSHQERLNGTGYPDGLNGKEIPYIVQVFQLVNIADAIISKRLHRSSATSSSDRPYWVQAVEEIKKEMEAGARDPALCETFFRFLELYYRGGG